MTISHCTTIHVATGILPASFSLHSQTPPMMICTAYAQVQYKKVKCFSSGRFRTENCLRIELAVASIHVRKIQSSKDVMHVSMRRSMHECG